MVSKTQCNIWQHAVKKREHRVAAYNFLRLCGFSSQVARKVRDWSRVKIVLYICMRRKKWCRLE